MHVSIWNTVHKNYQSKYTFIQARFWKVVKGHYLRSVFHDFWLYCVPHWPINDSFIQLIHIIHLYRSPFYIWGTIPNSEFPEICNILNCTSWQYHNVLNPAACFFFFFFFFWGTGVWTKGTLKFTLPRQALYHLNHSTSPFLCWIFFWDMVSQTICRGWLHRWSSWSVPPQ
jgi:hypothetical protein